MRPGTLRADLMLLGAAACWGTGFIPQRSAMEHIGPFTFNTARYAIGAAFVLPLLVLIGRNGARAPRWTPASVRGGVVLGLVLAGAAGLQQAGMVHTTAARAGFITTLYALMVPLIAYAMGQRPTLGNLVGVGLAAGGLVLFSGAVGGRLGGASNIGDWLVFASAGAWALHVVLIGVMAPRSDPMALVLVQFVTAAAVSGVVMACTEPLNADAIARAAGPIAYSGVLATGVAFVLQFFAQRHAPPTHATVLMSTEALFAAVTGWLVLSERLGWVEVAGGGLMIAGALCSQLIGQRARIAATGSDPTPAP